MKRQIAVIGECMIEVKPKGASNKSSGGKLDALIGYGGDTLNTSVYLSRLGTSVDYVTALGDDAWSDWLLGQWRAEGVGCDLVRRVLNAVPGLYMIQVDASGERSFSYWRENAPARALFDNAADAAALFEQLHAYPYLYLSGITLALYKLEVRSRLYAFLDAYRERGGKVLFDNNYRPRQWPTTAEAAHAFEQMYRRSDIAMPTVDDEVLLYGTASEAEVIARLQAWNVPEIVLKKGASGCAVVVGPQTWQVEADKVTNVVDTTAAGDSFNAGYIAARIGGAEPQAAAAAGNRLAARVVQFPGAIIPANAM